MKRLTSIISILLVFTMLFSVTAAAADAAATSTDAEPAKIPFEVVSAEVYGGGNERKSLDGAELSYTDIIAIDIVFSTQLKKPENGNELKCFSVSCENGDMQEYMYFDGAKALEDGKYMYSISIINPKGVPAGKYTFRINNDTKSVNGDILGKDVDFTFTVEKKTASWVIKNFPSLVSQYMNDFLNKLLLKLEELFIKAGGTEDELREAEDIAVRLAALITSVASR